MYAPMHIGHARTYSFWDFFRRCLEYCGYHVVSAINYTDVDDLLSAHGYDLRYRPSRSLSMAGSGEFYLLV